MTLSWNIHPDGSFDILAGGIELRGCVPSLDYAPIRPTAVTVAPAADGAAITYALAQGRLTLRLGRDAHGLVLAATLEGLSRAPHWVWPLGGAQVHGADRFYRQGLGFAGPSGLVEFAGPDPVSYESYLMTALRAADGSAVAIAALDHRDFIQKSTLHTRVERFGLINRHVTGRSAILEAGFGTECIDLPEGRCDLPPLHIQAGGSLFDTMRGLAKRVAGEMGARVRPEPMYHWCSWYYAHHHLSLERLGEFLDGMKTLQPPVPLQTVQIDAGYYPSPGDWLVPNERWPGGMEQAFRTIADAGYRPGIWIAPFMVGNRSRLYREHPDWVVRDLQGRPIVEARSYNGTMMAGMADEEMYALDASHPDAVAYLREVFRTMRRWGATFFKTDFMDWGFKDSSLVTQARPGRTSTQNFRAVLEMIRQEIGPDSYWLGCIAPFAPFLGYADAMRIGNDNSPNWGAGSTGNMLAESEACQYFNNVFWHNDPDVIYVRDFHAQLSPTEIPTLAYWETILGGVINTSDPLGAVGPQGRRLWRFCRPGARWTASLPRYLSPGPARVAVRRFEDTGGWAALAINTAPQPTTEVLTVRELTGLESAHAFTWAPGQCEPLGRVDRLVAQLPAHGHALYYISETDAPPPADLTLGGAREAMKG